MTDTPTPKKDIIYIDVDDDITSIIGKVKAADQKIVALVPPKRTGVLQSAVNLRLLQRTAEQQDKRLVLITGSSALTSLAASAGIPVAKNLQSKPELGEIAALDIDDGDDVIDGAQLSVGEHAGETPAAVQSQPEEPDTAAAVAAAIAADSSDETLAAPNGSASKSAAPINTGKPSKKGDKSKKIPNYNKFRKRLIIIIILALALIGFFVWAIFFAPKATVEVHAKTTDTPVSQQLTLTTSGTTSASDSTLKIESKQTSQDVSVDVTPTGEKNVGDKATGTVSFSNSSTSSKTVSAGTTLSSSSGAKYTLDSAVTVPGGTVSCTTVFNCSGTAGSASGKITAADRGAKYNGASGSLSGAPSSISASVSGSTSGGTDKTVKVVTSADVAKAKTEAESQVSSDETKAKLVKEFDSNYIVIEESFTASNADFSASPTVNAEVPDGTQAKYGGSVKYTLYAVNKSDLDEYITEVVKQQLEGDDSQKIYETGSADAKFTNFDGGNPMTATLSANAKVGPDIEESEVLKMVAGKRYGEIESEVKAINGVSSVDVNMSPFWVSKTPSDPAKITVDITVEQ